MANSRSNKQGNSMTVEEAGRKGGETTARTHGREFYQEIGRKGGEHQGKENNPGNFANRPHEDVAEAGRKGGES